MSYLNSSRWTAAAALFALVTGLAPVLAADSTETDSTRTGRIEARIQIRGEGESPQGTVLAAYHIDTKELFRSEPAHQKGAVVLDSIPYGYFDLAVEMDGRLYVASQVVVVPPSGKVVIKLLLEPYEDEDAAARSFQGSDAPVDGIARLSRKAVGREFWRGPAGIAIITGLSGAGLLAIASGAESDPISPFVP